MNQVTIETTENYINFVNNLQKQPKQQWEQFVSNFLIKYGVNIRAFNILLIVVTKNQVLVYTYYYNIMITLQPNKNGNIVIVL